MAKTPSSQSRGPGFDPWSGNYIPYAATESCKPQLNGLACCNKDLISHGLQPKPGTVKKINKNKFVAYANVFVQITTNCEKFLKRWVY